jgi:hypothetical protein
MAAANQVTFVSIPFVRTAEDVLEVRSLGGFLPGCRCLHTHVCVCGGGRSGHWKPDGGLCVCVGGGWMMVLGVPGCL